jgi:hypothetical protein
MWNHLGAKFEKASGNYNIIAFCLAEDVVGGKEMS